MIVHLKYIVWLAIAACILLSPRAKGQTIPCGNPHESQSSIVEREKLLLKVKQQLAKNFETANHTVQYIPIKAHILRLSNGTGGLSLVDLNKALNQANTYFININIQFYFCGTVNYINNSAFFDFNTADEGTLCAANDVPNALNLYFPNTIQFGSLAVSGYAYMPSTLSVSNRVFVQASNATDTRTLVHELGHYFNLLHTFQNSTASNLTEREYVTRDPLQGANCATTGDLLCDTPADPFGRDSLSLFGCSFQGTARDPQGNLYNPSLSNIMSYYPITCGNVFTNGQYTRMQDGLLLRTYGGNQYTLTCGPLVTGINVPSNLTATIGMSGISLSFTDNSSNETGFIIERSSVSNTEGFIPIAGLAPNVTTFLDQTTTAFTTYFYRVKASNSTDQYSSVYMISTALNYCQATYNTLCDPTPVLIDDFELKQGSTFIINHPNTNCSPSNYGDFTSTNYNVVAGTTYTFFARATHNGSGLFYDQHLSVWIDWDRDGLFELEERVYRSDSIPQMPRMNPTASGSFTIPIAVSAGVVRMRVRSTYNFGPSSALIPPCGLLDFGEVHDYSLMVAAAPPPTITTTSVSPSTVCAGQTISVSFTTTNLPSATYVVQLSDLNGNNFANIPTTGSSSPLTATLPPSTPSGTGYKVKVNAISPVVVGSETSSFTINALPSAPTAMTPIAYCQNQTALPLSASGSNLKWYTIAIGGVGNPTAPTPITTSAGTISYWVSQTVNNCESSRSQIDVITFATPPPPTITSPVNYTQGQTAVPLTATGQNLKWYNVFSGGTALPSAPTPSTATTGTANYYVSQTINNCEGPRALIQVNVSAPTYEVACPTIKVYLEGLWNGSQMPSLLNQKGLLPGQTPTDTSLGVPTPAGQPYSSAPWFYPGNESVASYNSNVVDWVLLSLRTNVSDTSSKVYETAALLRNNGEVSLVSACPLLNPSLSYYVVIEHRNHIGAASHQPISIVDNKITYDFTQQQSYIPINIPASGQKKIGLVYCLYAGDARKNSFSEINANDSSQWRIDNGKFSRYLSTDYNLNGDINAIDDILWRVNNGKFSGVNF